MKSKNFLKIECTFFVEAKREKKRKIERGAYRQEKTKRIFVLTGKDEDKEGEWQQNVEGESAEKFSKKISDVVNRKNENFQVKGMGKSVQMKKTRKN